MKIKGYENNSFSYVEHNLFQVIEYNNENITLIEISRDVIVHVYNFSLFESIPWIGPIGYYFIILVRKLTKALCRIEYSKELMDYEPL